MAETNIEQSTFKLSHKQRKAQQKKLKRKAKRQEAAQLRDQQLHIEEEIKKQSPRYQAKLAQEEYQQQAELLQIEAESRHQHELWVWSEERWAEQQKLKREQEERERLQKIEIEKKIKEEWEERQKREQEEEEARKKKKEKQEALLQQARDAENKDGPWHNPLLPAGKEREKCPFFSKVGACRFGERCSRVHPYPESSDVLLFCGMFAHFRLDQGLCEEFDTDIVLEYEDSELYQSFRDFYEDVLPEFRSCGEVIQFKVCCNYQAHLRGNVYVQFEREEDALKAFTKFNARWYGGKQLSCEFVTIPSWRAAICGMFGQGRCPKGKECNFLHVFNNPNREFWQADRGFNPRKEGQGYRNDGQGHRSYLYSDRSNRHWSRRRSRSHSRDRHHHDRRSPSRSKYSRRRYSRSRSRSNDRKSKYRKSRNSRSRSRSYSRSYSRSRSRSKERKYKKSRDRSRSRSRSYRYSRSRLRSRSREKYKKSKQRDSNSSDSDNDENVKNNRKDYAKDSSYVGHKVKDQERDSRSNSHESSRSQSRERKSHKKHKKHKHKKHKEN